MDWIIRAIQSLLTLYMLLILLRWLGPWIQLDLYSRRLRWIPALTDPFLNRLRSVMPPLGPIDLAPLVGVLLLWLLRVALVGLFAPADAGPPPPA